MCTERGCYVRIFIPGRSSCARSSQGVGQVPGECLSFTQMDQGAFFSSGAQNPMGQRVLAVKALSFWGIGCFTVLTELFAAFQFFAPLRPTRILVEYDSHGDATGEAEVHFESHEDAVAAMAREGAQMGKSGKGRGSYNPGLVQTEKKIQNNVTRASV